ncbi:hypothetical protein KSZ_65880 [Dictyobacter formicarum]|uniref:Uncharacterized protein n=1 Tax=Dictyobacter formicarum TaxID=2778368 RepID=A0ABQ3VRS8_9CHLR|nr:hypothetical protein KSZ_65880 [Dictyobacter formicarum]
MIFVLRLIAQPWQEHDSVAVITQLYAAAASEELGLGPERFFEDVVAAMKQVRGGYGEPYLQNGLHWLVSIMRSLYAT